MKKTNRVEDCEEEELEEMRKKMRLIKEDI